MKIRGKPINEVLKISVIDHDGKEEPIHNTNMLEIEFIIKELEKLQESGQKPSVGIITPHTNQQKRIVDEIGKLDERDYYYDELKLKIMTFDTCQGEERDIIFYSMVANENMDRLWGVFIKDLASVDIEEESKIKAQRLNVGFSRAKECIHLIMSKQIDQFEGSIRDTLVHYKKQLEDGKNEPDINDVDPSSPMEQKVLHWILQTNFWKENIDSTELKPQFPIGEYLRQLDKTYIHPKYKVDFLLIHNNQKIIIEYDGFEEHFKNLDEVNEFNYERYYSDDDVYRQKVLMGYGYKFLRINRFNCGNNPVETLNTRLYQLIDKQVKK